MLSLSIKDVANEVGVSANAIAAIENDSAIPRDSTLIKLRRFYAARGIDFWGVDGVTRHSAQVELYDGRDRFEDFYEFMYEHLASIGGDVCLSAENEKLFRANRRDFQRHCEIMSSLVKKGKITFRVIASESFFASTWAQYKRREGVSAAPTAFYAFGDCLALISFIKQDHPYVILIKSACFTAAYRSVFEREWKIAKTPPSNYI